MVDDEATVRQLQETIDDYKRKENRSFVVVWIVLALVFVAIGGWVKGALWPERDPAEIAEGSTEVVETCSAKLEPALRTCVESRPEGQWMECRRDFMDKMERCTR